jgi:hypothetical protein
MALRQLTLWLQRLQVQPPLGKLFQQPMVRGQAHQRQHLHISGNAQAWILGAQLPVLMYLLQQITPTQFAVL